MTLRTFDAWLNYADLPLIAFVLFAAMCVAAAIGVLLQRTRGGSDREVGAGEDGYIVSAVLGLLALLLGFTFSMATERFDARRLLVLDEANAVGTAYLRSQLLPQPHRARMSDLLVRYTDNRVALGRAAPQSAEQRRRMQANDALLTDIWAGTSAAFDSVRDLPFSAPYVESINAVIDLDESRKTARLARVPAAVFAVLFVYLVTTAGVLGYVLHGARGRLAAGFLLALLTLSLTLIIDINRPGLGNIVESQQPMEDLLRSLAGQPPSVFDKWRTPAVPPPSRR